MIKKIRLVDIVQNKKIGAQLAHKHAEIFFSEIRAGRVIRRSYAESTKKRRRKYGLGTSRVDLTGNIRYSNKSWRLLDSSEWYIRPKSIKIYQIRFKRNTSKRIWASHVQRYPTLRRKI